MRRSIKSSKPSVSAVQIDEIDLMRRESERKFDMPNEKFDQLLKTEIQSRVRNTKLTVIKEGVNAHNQFVATANEQVTMNSILSRNETNTSIA